MDITLDTPLTQFPGVGEARSKKLEKLGLTRCEQLLTYFPRDYEDRRQIWSIRSAPWGRRYACGPWWPSTPSSPASERAWSW